MTLTQVRSYREDVVEPLERLARRDLRFDLGFMGFTEHEREVRRLLYLSIGGNEAGDKQDVLLSAGIHGEEPAGVYALLNFLESGIHDFLGAYRFLVFPCVNPFGFEYGVRLNPAGFDVNRNFRNETSCLEAAKVMRVLSRLDRRFTCTVDLHETDPDWAGEGFSANDNPKGFYMWEVCSIRNMRVGREVVKEVARLAPVCDWPYIYGDHNSRGVIWYPEGSGNNVYAQGTTFEAYLNRNYSPQSFTLETSCAWDMALRTSVHLTAVEAILKLKRNA